MQTRGYVNLTDGAYFLVRPLVFFINLNVCCSLSASLLWSNANDNSKHHTKSQLAADKGNNVASCKRGYSVVEYSGDSGHLSLPTGRRLI